MQWFYDKNSDIEWQYYSQFSTSTLYLYHVGGVVILECEPIMASDDWKFTIQYCQHISRKPRLIYRQISKRRVALEQLFIHYQKESRRIL